MFAVDRLEGSHTLAASASSHLTLAWVMNGINDEWHEDEYKKIEVSGLKIHSIILMKDLPLRRWWSRRTSQTISLDGNLNEALLYKHIYLLIMLIIIVILNGNGKHDRPTFTVNSWAVHLFLVELKVFLVLLRARFASVLCWVTTSDSRFCPLNINAVVIKFKIYICKA